MNTLPLFLLPVSACPMELVPLHIFEPRYKAMIADCLSAQETGGGGEFVIALASASGMASIGAIMKLVKVMKRYDDGRLDILTQGRRRCLICETPSECLYRMAEVSPYEDERGDWSEALANEAFNLHRALLQLMTGTQPEASMYAGVAHLSFLLAATIGLEHQAKQSLLELRSENERLRRMIEHMTVLMTQVEQVQLAARSIQGCWELQRMYGPAGGVHG